MKDDFDDRPYVDDRGTTWIVIRCPGCGKPCGYSTPDGLRRALYCSLWCVWEYELRAPVEPTRRAGKLTPREIVKDTWYWLYQSGRAPSYVAQLYGISRDWRVHKAITSRKVDDEKRTQKKRSRRVGAVKRRRSSSSSARPRESGAHFPGQR